MKKSRIVQINNQYIQDENLRHRFEEAEQKKKNRFLGFSLVLIVLLFILPTYNMMATYANLQERKQEIVDLGEELKDIEEKTIKQQELADRLKNNEYVEKYARAKYYYAIEGETIFLLPELLPK